MSDKKQISLYLTVDQYNLARRRLLTEDLNWQKVLRALVNAYITGDITVTQQGRYTLFPPQSLAPQVKIPKDGDLIDIEVDWSIGSDRPQVGTDNREQRSRRRSKWGTRELTAFLRESTGRKLRIQSVRLLLRSLEVPKANGKQWSFTGPDDPSIPKIIAAIHDGTYDAIVREGLDELTAKGQVKRQQEREHKDATKQTEAQRRAAHLRRLRNL